LAKYAIRRSAIDIARDSVVTDIHAGFANERVRF
jgi:hypothetical protein